LVEDAVEKNLPASALLIALKGLGLRAVEAADCIDEFNQRIAIHHSKARQHDSPPHDSPIAESDGAQDQENRDKAVEEAAWALLHSKYETAAPDSSLNLSSGILDRVFDLLGQDTSTSNSLSK
jgi:hypothetical protein